MKRVPPASDNGGWGESLLERCACQREGTTESGIRAGGAMEHKGGPEIYLSAGG